MSVSHDVCMWPFNGRQDAKVDHGTPRGVLMRGMNGKHVLVCDGATRMVTVVIRTIKVITTGASESKSCLGCQPSFGLTTYNV